MPHAYVIRHGETTCNADGIIQGPRIDSQLSARGHAQAAALGDAFRQTHVDEVIVSPLQRARDTAQGLAGGRGIPVEVAPELYELDFGHHCGQAYESVREDIAQVVDAWGMGFYDEAFPGGESPALAQHRVRPLAEAVHKRVEREDVAIVAHGRINRILLGLLTGLGLRSMGEFPQANGAITHLEWAPQATVRRRNDVSHLAHLA